MRTRLPVDQRLVNCCHWCQHVIHFSIVYLICVIAELYMFLHKYSRVRRTDALYTSSPPHLNIYCRSLFPRSFDCFRDLTIPLSIKVSNRELLKFAWPFLQTDAGVKIWNHYKPPFKVLSIFMQTWFSVTTVMSPYFIQSLRKYSLLFFSGF